MRAYDLSPLLRSSIGFDRFNRLFDAASRVEDVSAGFPPYNIEKRGEDQYRVTLAVAGVSDAELDITVQENTLIVSGKGSPETAEKEANYLHRGIARRAFERRFELADTLKVTGASLDNGLLNVDLVRVVPEALKPRQIKINAGSTAQPTTIDAKAA